MDRYWIVVIIVVYSLAIALQIGSLAAPEWATVNGYRFGLSTCSNCKDLKQLWTVECFAREMCEKGDESCEVYDDLFNAGSVYTYFQIFSVYFGIITLEKIFLILLSKDFGNKLFFHVFSCCHIFILLSSLIAWFVISKINYSDMLLGPKLIISALALSMTGGVYLNMKIFFSKEKKDSKEFAVNKICGLNVRVFIISSIVLAVVSISLVLAGIIDENWVSNSSFNGSLARCQNCYQIDWMSWSCIKGYYCSINESSALCETFTDIDRSVRYYIPLQLISIIFIFLSLQPVSSMIVFLEYGPNYMTHIYIGLGLLFNIIGSIVYGSISGVRFNENCSSNLCAGEGFILIITSNFFMAGYFGIVLFVRSKLRYVSNEKLYYDKSTTLNLRKVSSEQEDILKMIQVSDGERMDYIISQVELVNQNSEELNEYKKFNTIDPNFIEVKDLHS